MPNNLMAVLYVVLAVLFFNINDSLMKGLFVSEPIYVVISMRALLVVGILTTCILVLVRGNPLLGLRDRGTMIFGAGECLIAMPYLTALMFLSLGVSAALIFTAPIITTALGAIVLREKVGRYRWSAVVLGFLGVLMIAVGEPLARGLFPELVLRLSGVPTDEKARGLSGQLQWILLAPLFAAFGLSVRDMLARAIPSKLPTTYNATYAAVFVLLSAVASFFIVTPMFPDVFQPTMQGRSYFGVLMGFSPGVWIKLVLSASLISVAYYLSALALRTGELSLISPFRYVGLPSAMVLDFMLFKAVPQWNEYSGALVIVLAGLVILWRETRLGQLKPRHPANRRG
ncbi:MAG: hypothetical protein CMF26_04940 [Kiloniella sp.]|nr:hypothetical protein [Kiloniella sp.]